MALRKKIDKAEFDKLSKDVQANYTANGDNYILDLENDDAAELRRAKDHETVEKNAAVKKAKELQEQIDALKEERGPENKDSDLAKQMKALERKLEKQAETNAAAIAERDAKLAARDTQTKRSMIDAAAMAIASKISNAPKPMAKMLAERFDVDLEGETPQLIILGTDGKPSSMTQEQLTKEFVANKDYASMIIGSRASGSGAPSDRDTSRKTPSGAGNSGEQAPDLSKLLPKDLAARIKERKESQQQP